MLLDAALGEPKLLWDRIPHPAVLMGRLIGWADKRFNTGPAQTPKGTILMIILGSGSLALGTAIHAVFGRVGDVIICAMLLAQRSLCDHVAAVGDALRISLGDGRRARIAATRWRARWERREPARACEARAAQSEDAVGEDKTRQRTRRSSRAWRRARERWLRFTRAMYF